MAGLDPAIHVLLGRDVVKTWMPGTRPGMTVKFNLHNQSKFTSNHLVTCLAP